MTKAEFVAPPKEEASPVEPDRAGPEHYRLFSVNSDDKFQGFQVHEGPSDTEALERARGVLAHHPYAAAIEVWRHGVLVGRVNARALAVF
jgi:hypothetical protein